MIRTSTFCCCVVGEGVPHFPWYSVLWDGVPKQVVGTVYPNPAFTLPSPLPAYCWIYVPIIINYYYNNNNNNNNNFFFLIKNFNNTLLIVIVKIQWTDKNKMLRNYNQLLV